MEGAGDSNSGHTAEASASTHIFGSQNPVRRHGSASEPPPYPPGTQDTGRNREEILQNSILLAQPVDIIHAIAEKLDAENVILLSLSCRVLHTILFRENLSRSLTLTARHTLLALVEKDFASTFYLCGECIKLHRFIPSRGLHEWRHYHEQDRHFDFQRPFMAPCTIPALSYNHCRLVMNRHRYGPAAGVSLSTLESNAAERHRQGWPGLMTERYSRARIIDDELYFSQTYVLRHESGSDYGLAYALRIEPYHICLHQCTGYTEPDAKAHISGLQGLHGSCI